MPFVPNDISNVSLPIVAVTSTGLNGSAGLPIEFEGGYSGGVITLQAPGPITFGAGIQAQSGEPSDPLFSVVYSPPNSGSTAAPVQVSLQVLGTYDNGRVGPMPSGVQLSFPQPTFELEPYSVFYFPVAENNSLKPSNATTAAAYTFAVQEKVGNSTYVEPLNLSVSLEQIFAGPASGAAPITWSAQSAGSSAAGVFGEPWGAGVLILIAIAAVIVLGVAATFLRRRMTSKKQGEEGQVSIPTS
jgi:hypothetical protein